MITTTAFVIESRGALSVLLRSLTTPWNVIAVPAPNRFAGNCRTVPGAGAPVASAVLQSTFVHRPNWFAEKTGQTGPHVLSSGFIANRPIPLGAARSVRLVGFESHPQTAYCGFGGPAGDADSWT